MPRYFFDIKDDEDRFHDEEGTELPNMQQAYDEAIATLLEIAKSKLPQDGRSRLVATVKNGDEVAFKTTLALTVSWFTSSGP